MPPGVATAPAAAAPPTATGSPVSLGGYAGVVSGGPAPTPAEPAGHEARVWSASRGLERPRPKAASPAAGSRAEERERSPRGHSALAAALAAEAAVAEAERHVSTDDYMPDAGGDKPEDDAGLPSAPHSHSASFGSPGSIGELRTQVATTAALLRMAIDVHGPASGVDAARADAAAAEAALDTALARSGEPPVRPLPQSVKPIYKAPPPPLPRFGPPVPRSLRPVLLPLRPGLLGFLPPRMGMLPVAGAPDAPGCASASPGDAAAIPVSEPARVFLLPAGPPWAAMVARRARSGLAGALSRRHSPRPTLGTPSTGEALPPQAIPGTPILPAPT